MTAAADSEHPLHRLRRRAAEWRAELDSADFARVADMNDPLRRFRSEFHFPKVRDLPLARPRSDAEAAEDSIYLCGNSLGLMPRCVREELDTQLQQWAQFGVFGHRHGRMPWAFCDEWLVEDMGAIVGAGAAETCMMNSLTVNLHLMLTAFYRPEGTRTKILLERQAFPSDHYAIESQVRQRGRQPEEEMLFVQPREGESCIRTEDVLQLLASRGAEIATVCLPGVQYYTGQRLDIPAITAAARAAGCTVGWDLAHSVGNVPLQLHDWNVDFAVWCTYKYLCCGAGCMAGAFVHERHFGQQLPQLTGWWGHRIETRFDMSNRMEPADGAGRFRVTNPSMVQAACVRASLNIFKLAGMQPVREKSLLLTAYLEHLLKLSLPQIKILTPADPEQRGAQLSLLLPCSVDSVLPALEARGVACDERKPSVIRVAPAPLYNSFTDVHRFVRVLADVMGDAAA